MIRSILGYDTWEDYKREFPKLKSKLKYKFGFTDKLKEEIKQFYNYKCSICKTTENLHIHHIDSNWRNNEKTNLLCICNECHKKTH